MDMQLGGGGGNDSDGGLYGTLGQRDTEALCLSMRLTHDSVLFDLGSGIGRPLMCALVSFSIAGAKGVEINWDRWYKSVELCKRVAAEFNVPVPELAHGDAASVATLDPATHVYACWEGWNERNMQHVAKLFNQSRTAYFITVVHMKQKQGRGSTPAFLARLGFFSLQPVSSGRRVICGNTVLYAFTLFKANS